MSTWNWYVDDTSIFIFLIFKKFKFFGHVVDSQCCVSLRCTAKWFSYIQTYIHSLDSLSQDVDSSFLKMHSCTALPRPSTLQVLRICPLTVCCFYTAMLPPPPATPDPTWVVPAPGTCFPSFARPITACTPRLTSVSPSPGSLHDPRHDTRKGVKGWRSVPGWGADLGGGEPSSPRGSLCTGARADLGVHPGCCAEAQAPEEARCLEQARFLARRATGKKLSSSKTQKDLNLTSMSHAEAEGPVLWPPDVKSRQLIGKDPDAGKD